MPKPESFPIEKIFVPTKQKKAIMPEVVGEIAESMLDIGQQAPFPFGSTETASFWSRDCIGSKPARRSARRPFSVSWFRPSLRYTSRSSPNDPRSKQNASRWRD